MAPATDNEPNYSKYLTEEPTALMKHIEEWLRDKADVDPTKDFKSKNDAFAMGVYLTVHLRGVHQASPENQARLQKNAELRDAADAERAERRQRRVAVGASPRGRMPKAAAEPEPAPEKVAPKRRGRPPASKAKAKAKAEPVPAPPKTRRPAKAATPAPVPAPEPAPAPKRRGRPRKVAADATPAPVEQPKTEVPSNVTPLPTKTRRRPVRRTGEAAF